MGIKERILKLDSMISDLKIEIRIKENKLKRLKTSGLKISIDKENIYELEKEIPLLKISLKTLINNRKALVLEQVQEEMEKRAA